MILNFFGGQEADYNRIVQILWNTRNNLTMVTLTVTSILVSIIGIMTWLLCLYASFRLAGPIYRLENLLENEITDQNTSFTHLRENDLFLLKLSYHSLRKAVLNQKKLKDDVNNKIDAIIIQIENENFSKAVVQLQDLECQIAKIKT